MKVQILYTADCPNLTPARTMVEQVLASRGIIVKVEAVELRDARDAAAHANFAGSPTVLVNGRDVESGPRAGFACRIYAGGGRLPARQSIERAIERALTEEGSCNDPR